MITYTPEQYNDILFNKLPQEVRDVVLNSETTKHLWKIGEKHKLQIDKVGIMHDLSMDTMMGIIATKNFVKELQNELGISAFDAATIARDIDDEIFKPIKDVMVKLYADGAPNKPSSSLVQFYEEDEEHPSLDKDALLKEIENPTVAKPRIEQVVVTSKAIETPDEVKDLEQMKQNAGIGKTVELKSIEALKERPGINGTEAVKPQIPLAPKLELKNISSTLDKIASMKLSRAFVMPKEGGLNPITLNIEPKPVAPVEDKSKLTAASTPPLIVAKPDATPYTPPSAKYPVDPYREPAN